MKILQLEETLHEFDITDASQFWNFDEKGFMVGQGSHVNVVVLRHHLKESADVRVEQDSSREWITTNICVSAAGDHMKPTVLFRGGSLRASWLKDQPLWCYVGATERGWTNDAEGIQFAKRFVVDRLEL